MGKWKLMPNAGGHYLADGTEVERGQTIECSEKELGGARDKFECIEPDPPAVKIPPNVGLVLRDLGRGWYDVVNEKTGRALNDKHLRREAAQELVEEYAESDADTTWGGAGEESNVAEPEVTASEAAVAQEPEVAPAETLGVGPAVASP